MLPEAGHADSNTPDGEAQRTRANRFRKELSNVDCMMLDELCSYVSTQIGDYI